MNVAQSLRKVAVRLGGGDGGQYDDYEDETHAPRDEADRGYRERRDVRPVALEQPSDFEFVVVVPRNFDDAQQIADRVRGDASVIIELQGCDEELAKRLIDFCSGLTYALDGRLQYVADRTILLTPNRVELSGEATVGLREEGFFNRI
jgi:cell division inhibitor SepF